MDLSPFEAWGWWVANWFTLSSIGHGQIVLLTLASIGLGGLGVLAWVARGLWRRGWGLPGRGEPRGPMACRGR